MVAGFPYRHRKHGPAISMPESHPKACRMTFERLIVKRVALFFASALVPLLTCSGPSFADDVAGGWKTTVLPMTESEPIATRRLSKHALEGGGSDCWHREKTCWG